MTVEAWQNLGLAALFVFYIVQFILDGVWGNLCGHLAIDYCSFWSAGFLANTKGYGAMYDLQLMRQVQTQIFPHLQATTPTPFMPVFILPFQVLALLQPAAGYWVWTLLNIAALIGYLFYFSRQVTQSPAPGRFFVLVLLSIPVFTNFFTGQINVWLTICMGQFLLDLLADRPYRAGLWLAGLLLKPQLMILILPVLLLQRAVKSLIGFTAGACLLIAASLALAGPDGLQSLIRLWLGYAGGLPTNDVGIMMNWRMIGLHLADWTTASIAWPIAALGMLVTVLFTFFLARKRFDMNSSSLSFLLLGTLAATGAVTWHSHIHTAMILIPVFLFLTIKNWLAPGLLAWWVFLPGAVYGITVLLAALIQLSVLPADLGSILDLSRGLSEFGLNLYLLWYASQKLKLQPRML